MPEAQAEVQAAALAEIALAQVVTKEDLRQAMAELERTIEALERKLDGVHAELTGDMREMELRIVGRLEAELRKQMVWFFGILVVLGGALVALLRAILPAM